LRGEAALDEHEARGLAIFNDQSRGNCAQCHKSQMTAGGKPPLFTDFGYVAVGLPRNRSIPANADPGYFDMGLCGPRRTDLVEIRAYCGMFKTPTLRNVAVKRSFYHNDVVHTLRDAVAFYAERDTKPERWYPAGPDGVVRRFDDLPGDVAANVSMDLPFGGKAVLSEADVDDLVAFLRTLTDGFNAEKRH
jgi:cytochrome c peroxidase